MALRVLSAELLDPAEQVLQKEEEAKRRRRQEETRITLERIKKRILGTLEEYSRDSDNGQITALLDNTEPAVIDFDSIDNPAQLYDLLRDVRVRAKYEKHLMIVLVGFEEKCQAKEEVLLSLDDFFQETKSGKAETLMKELEAGTVINLEESTVGFKNAIQTTMQAASKLTAIVKEISQILAVAAAFPDNKKGRKKLEKALAKAEEKIQKMSQTLETLEESLEKSRHEYDELKTTVELKNTECIKLRKTADRVKKLETYTESLKAELSSVTETLKKKEEDLKSLPSTEVRELEVALESSQKICHQMQIERDQHEIEVQEAIDTLKCRYEKTIADLQLQHQKEVASVQSQHEKMIADIQLQQEKAISDMKLQHEEEMQSLMATTEDEGDLDTGNKEESEDKDDRIEQSIETIQEVIVETVQEIEDTDASTEAVRDGEAIIIAALQKEHVEKVNALKSEMETVKSKSKKVIASLKAQLVETRNQLESKTKEEMAKLSSTIEDLEEERERMRIDIDQVTKEKNELLELKLHQELTVAELQLVIENLQREMQSLNDHNHVAPPMRDMATHSTQWSDRSHVSSHSIESMDKLPLIPLEEVIHSAKASSSSGVNVIEVYALPLHSQSLVDDQPVSATGPSGSQSSQKSSQIISSDHSLVQDWMKMYDNILKFKASVLDLIQCRRVASNIALKDVIQDLQSQASLRLDVSKEIQGQVTQMRFTISLTLHQLETALHECFSGLPQVVVEHQTVPQISEETTQLHLNVANLKHQVRQKEEQYQAVLQSNHDTIANLTMKIENLKSETSHLRQLLDQSSAGIGTVFFTRLDVERNDKALQEAKRNHQINEEDYQLIVSDMNEYMKIPGQKFCSIARQLSHMTRVKEAIASACESLNSPEHTARIISIMQHLHERKKQLFNQKMRHLSAKRLKVANDLQVALLNTEKQTGLFFVKPIYPIQPHSALMVPLQRVPPTGRVSSRVPAQVQSRGRTAIGRHPTLSLIDDIRSSLSNGQQFRDCRDDICETPRLQQIRPNTENSQKWSISTSRVHSAVSHSYSPLLPRFVELETSRLREPSSLLKRRSQQNDRENGSLKKQMSPSLPPIHIPNYGTTTVPALS